ncbi:MAG: demethylmenaquinone methyltransferase [Gracilibacteraceae bacterium]|nr:demethylmenaquinone methyltransferase [Gracilibacteraceae bacterium]
MFFLTRTDREQKEQKVHAVFQKISNDYDKMNDIICFGMHRKWKRDLVNKITKQNRLSILDVCCGTGDIALQLARSNPQANICGLDFSENMLAVAEERKAQLNLANIQFQHGNAMALPFDDASFQCATISFGLRNVPDYEQVLRELWRILEPDGVLYCLDSSYPESPFVKPFFKLYFKYIMPAVGHLFSRHKEEYQWLNDSTEQFLTKNELRQLLHKVGFRGTAVHAYFLGSAALHRGTK